MDYDLLRKNPKIFLGFSDSNAMHLAIQKRAGLVTFHGPVALSDFSDYTQKHFRRALFETAPLGALTNPPDSNPLRPSHTLRTIRGGQAPRAPAGGHPTLVFPPLRAPLPTAPACRRLLAVT